MPNSLTIRPLTQADIPGLAHWVAAMPLWQRYDVTEVGFAERLRQGLDSAATLFVAERAHEVLGFLWLVERGAFNQSAYIQLIGVRADARGGGIGRALMEFGQAHTTSRDLFLLVSDFNTDAQSFYTRLGYVEVGKLDDYVVPGITELIFCKRLR